MKVHHIGYLVKDIHKSIPSFEELGYSIVKKTVYDKARDVNICFMQQDGYCIELVEPCSEKSVVYDQLKRQGNTPYHICYEVDDLESTIEEYRSQKYVLMQPPAVAPAIDGRRVAFMFHRTVGMIELVEMTNNR